MSELRCSICNKTFTELPRDAVKIGQRSGAHQMYLFSDGAVHRLSSTKIGQILRKTAQTVGEKHEQ